MTEAIFFPFEPQESIGTWDQEFAKLAATVTGIKTERDYLRGKCDQLLIERAQLIEALEQIRLGQGEFNRDPLEHAKNTISGMKENARAVLAMVRR